MLGRAEAGVRSCQLAQGSVLVGFWTYLWEKVEEEEIRRVFSG